MGGSYQSGTTGVTGTIGITNKLSGIAGCGHTAGATTARDDTYTVPAGKIWILTNFCINRANTGVNYVMLTIGGTAVYIYQGATLTFYNQVVNVQLSAGDTVKVSMGSGTSGQLISDITYTEYTA